MRGTTKNISICVLASLFVSGCNSNPFIAWNFQKDSDGCFVNDVSDESAGGPGRLAIFYNYRDRESEGHIFLKFDTVKTIRERFEFAIDSCMLKNGPCLEFHKKEIFFDSIITRDDGVIFTLKVSAGEDMKGSIMKTTKELFLGNKSDRVSFRIQVNYEKRAMNYRPTEFLYAGRFSFLNPNKIVNSLVERCEKERNQ